MYTLIDTTLFQNLNPSHGHRLTAPFIEGGVLAANLTPSQLNHELWVQCMIDSSQEKVLSELLTKHFEVQYAHLMANEYDILTLLSENDEQLKEFAHGFLTVWQVVEEKWQAVSPINDGTLRMLQALITTFMLAIDEASSQAQMQESGITHPPTWQHMKSQLPVMINEVAMAADSAMQGDKSQVVNPYKNVGRNESCPCGSSLKFKKCCGA